MDLFQVLKVELALYGLPLQLRDAEGSERLFTLLEVFRRTGTYQIVIGARS